MDLTNYRQLDAGENTRRVLTCTFKLSKIDMLEALMSDSIIINERQYLVPEKVLLHCLTHKIYGEIELQLEEMKP